MIYPEDAVLLAPLAGHTDVPMRRSCRRYGCRFAFTEMIDAGSLVFGNLKTMRLAERAEDEPFLGIQLVGSGEETLKKACEIINRSRYDVLDFNLGCPAPKVEKKCEGITLALKKPETALRLAELLVRHSRIPVTVKTRIQDFTDPEPTVRFLKGLENAGVQAITLHGRVMKAFYSGEVSFEVMKEAARSLRIPLIANGGIMDRKSCENLRERTGIRRVMVARGALGNPWLFRELTSPEFRPPTVAEFAEEIRIHFLDMIDFYGPEIAFKAGRKTLLEYLRGRGYPGELRSSVSFLSDLTQFYHVIGVIKSGPADGYWKNLEHDPDAPRRLSAQ